MFHATELVLRSRPRLVLFIATLAAYAPSLNGPFQFDDFGVVVNYAPVHSLAGWWASLGGLRPLLKLTYALSWTLGLGALGFHLVNLAIHLVNVELVLRLYAAALHRGECRLVAPIQRGAFAAALLFAVHPIQTEAVTYVSGRSSSLMTLFMLVAVLLYIEGVRSRRAWLWLGLAPVAFACAFFTKEAAAILPASLLLWELCFERKRVRALLVRQAAWWSLFFGLLAWAIMQQSYFSLLYDMTGTRPLIESLRYQVEGASYLLSRLVLVHRLSIDPGLGLHPPSPATIFIGTGVLSMIFVLALTQIRTRPLVTFGALWFLLHVFMPYVVTPRMDVLNERHMYLANAGLFTALGALWGELVHVARVLPVARRIGVAVAVLLVIGTAWRNLDYRNAIALWESTVRVSPSNPRAHNNLGIAYESSGRLVDARVEYAAALVLEPRYEDARQNLQRVTRNRHRH